jgi:hypothetical protein
LPYLRECGRIVVVPTNIAQMFEGRGTPIWMDPPYFSGLSRAFSQPCAHLALARRKDLFVSKLASRSKKHQWHRTACCPYRFRLPPRGREPFSGTTTSGSIAEEKSISQTGEISATWRGTGAKPALHPQVQFKPVRSKVEATIRATASKDRASAASGTLRPSSELL